VVGNLTSKFRKSFEDKLDLKAADAHGALITSKTVNIADLPPGNYHLAVRITDPHTSRVTAQTGHFTVLDAVNEIQPIVVSHARPATPQRLAADHYERALCWMAQGRAREAITELEASYEISRNPTVGGLLDHLRQQTRATARKQINP
jgi:hypothetical protein